MPTPLRVLPPAAAFVGRMTAAAAAMASAPVQRGSLRNAQAALALHHPIADGFVPTAVDRGPVSLARPEVAVPPQG